MYGTHRRVPVAAGLMTQRDRIGERGLPKLARRYWDIGSSTVKCGLAGSDSPTTPWASTPRCRSSGPTSRACTASLRRGLWSTSMVWSGVELLDANLAWSQLPRRVGGYHFARRGACGLIIHLCPEPWAARTSSAKEVTRRRLSVARTPPLQVCIRTVSRSSFTLSSARRSPRSKP